MHKYKIVKDDEFKYSSQIKKRLTAYNKQQSGYKEKDVRHFYIFDDDNLVGACHTKQNSDWCHIKKIYYQDLEVLKALMNDIKRYYQKKVVGIKYNSILEDRVIDFKELGFIKKGALKDMPEGYENVFLLDKNLEYLDVDKNFESKSSRNPIYHYDKILKKEIRKIRENLEFSSDVIDIQYVVLDNGKFVGGIYGNFQYEYLFINRLFVDENYRGNRLASRLMNIIEKEALKRGVTNIYLTTFEFQALGFYKKKGYKLVMEIEDYPKGFKEYTVYKKLKNKKS